jgi:hypothetical protein
VARLDDPLRVINDLDTMMAARRLGLFVSGIPVGFAILMLLRDEFRARADKPGPCARWQTALAPVGELRPLEKPPEMGTIIPANAPSGWEPFAVGPTGAVYYRRCVP